MKLTKKQLQLMIQEQAMQTLAELNLDKAMLKLLLIKSNSKNSKKVLTLGYHHKLNLSVLCDLTVLVNDFSVLILITLLGHGLLQELFDANVSITIPLTSIKDYINDQISKYSLLLMTELSAAMVLKLEDYLKLLVKVINNKLYDYYKLLYIQDSDKFRDQIYRSIKNDEKLALINYTATVLK